MLTRHTLFRLRNLLHAVLAIAACGATSAFAQAGIPANGATAYTEKSRGRELPGLPRLCRHVFVT